VRPFLVAGEYVTGTQTRPVSDPYSGKVVDEVAVASWEQVDRALDATARAFDSTRRQSAFDRSRMLSAASGAIRMRAEELTQLIVSEGGKPYKNA
jgi:succinate-semialdehyde dehydrogenase/glutarate-semialdehyde dehydrogenase